MKPTAFNRSNFFSKAFPCSIMLSLLAAMPASAANRNWSGSAGDGGLWATTGNWTTTLLLDGTDGLRFAGTNVTNNNNITAGNTPGTGWFATLNFINTGAGGTGTSATADSAFNLTGNAITLANVGAITTTASTAVINDTISLDVAMTSNNPSITTNTNHNLTIAGILSGPTGSVTKAGAGTLTLSGGANTYTGRTVVSAGALVLSNSLALQNSSLDTTGAGVVNLSGITTLTLGGLTGATGDLASVITTGYSSLTALTLNNSSAQDYPGVIADGAAGMTLIKTGTGTQTLSGISANTYTGVTTINAGILKLSKTGVNAIAGNISVGDSTNDDVLQLGASDQISDTGLITLNGAVVGQRGQFVLSSFNETIGGLSGDGLVQNTSSLANSVLTLNVANATTLTSGAAIRNTGTLSTGTLGIVKTGAGTQILTGGLTYTGSTAINGGTLAIHTGSNPSTPAITFSGGGILDLDIAYTVNASASTAVDFTGGSVSVTGTPTLPSYTLVRALSMTGGTPTLATSISGYALQVVDLGTEKQLRLVSTGSPYTTWAGGAAFDADANGDGVKNGMAFLLGATGPSAAVTLPTVTQSGGNLVLNFNMLKPANRGTATLSVEHSRDIGIADPWTTVPATDASSGPTNGVTFVVTPGGGTTNAVQATIGSAEADGTGKLFARLRSADN